MQEVFENIIKALEEKRDEAEKNMELSDVLSEVNSYGGMFDALDKAIEIINQTAAEYNNGWIPCSERLPKQEKPFQTEEYTVTMVYVKNGKKSRPFTSNANFDYAYEKWMVKDYEVIAWREKIEPYKPKGDKHGT